MTQEKETLEQELSDINEAREWEKEELERKDVATKQEIMELHTVNGRLQLELKCVQQEVKLYEYRLLAEQDKVDRLQVRLHAVHTNKASLCSAVDGTVSANALTHPSKDAAEVLPTIDESRSSDVVSTQSITPASSNGQSAATLPVPCIFLKYRHFPNLVEAMITKRSGNGMNNLN